MTTLAITAPGPGELIIIALILVLLFGAKKLPELGGAVGKSIKGFKKGMEDDDEDVTSEDRQTPITRDGQ